MWHKCPIEDLLVLSALALHSNHFRFLHAPSKINPEFEKISVIEFTLIILKYIIMYSVIQYHVK